MSMHSNYKSNKYKSPITYAVKHKSIDVRMASQSGGAFTAISDYILNENGVVYGCIVDKDFNAVHFRADNPADRDKMRKSKYIQSDMGNMFRLVKSDLVNNRIVLFSGTSCQAAGLLAYLGKEYSNLICLDIVCHGVPSPKVWKDYLYWQENHHKEKIHMINFRNKTDFGWRSHVETLIFENGKKVNSKIFTTLFYSHMILRPSCFCCPYKDIIHPADITIADYWGIENINPDIDDNKGISLVLINNERGKEIFDKIITAIEYQVTRIEDSLQPPLVEPFNIPNNRKNFWDDYHNVPFKKIANKYGKQSVFAKIKQIIVKPIYPIYAKLKEYIKNWH